MKVELKNNWFSPTDPMGSSLSLKSGRMLRKGIVEIDDRWVGMLPPNCIIIEGPAVVEEPAPEIVEEQVEKKPIKPAKASK